MDNDRESKIPQYLQEMLSKLERQLSNPQNTWKRREEIQAQIQDVQKRLALVTRSHRRDRSAYPGRRSQRNIQRV